MSNKIETIKLKIKRLEALKANLGIFNARKKVTSAHILYYFNTNDVKHSPTALSTSMYDVWAKSKASIRVEALKDFKQKRYLKLAGKITKLKKKLRMLTEEKKVGGTVVVLGDVTIAEPAYFINSSVIASHSTPFMYKKAVETSEESGDEEHGDYEEPDYYNEDM